ncbi:MAG TPA: hypothetical protein VNF71_01910 [Acidimicrobiales bacterium]|nr:hypothetical protein [Acidimicrobiales bacterium]
MNYEHTGSPTVIEVFADIWCPFTHVGLHALSEQLGAEDRRDVRIWVRSWPLEWVNGKPMDADHAVRHSVELREQATPYLFEEFDGSHFPKSTIPVLALVAKGYKVGYRVGESLSFEVREFLFEHGQDVSDPVILSRIGRYYDLGPPGPDDYATVVADWKEGIDRGVRGSPHFFCGEADIYCPSLDIATQPEGKSKTIRGNLERLGLFVDGCR